jgi:formylglycine-generating enzyme required for sulfatase activity
MGNNPSRNAGWSLPVHNVTKNEVREFIKALNGRVGDETYRLPTEAEWEYACRAGTATPFNTGGKLTRNQANYNESGFDRAVRVGRFPPNDWGLFDMHGNVGEWCIKYTPGSGGSDFLSGDRVIRGGHYESDAEDCGCGETSGGLFMFGGSESQKFGFRIVREIR